MSIMAFVKKKKEAALATRVSKALPGGPKAVTAEKVINSEETFNANRNFLAAFEDIIGKEVGCLCVNY